MRPQLTLALLFVMLLPTSLGCTGDPEKDITALRQVVAQTNVALSNAVGVRDEVIAEYRKQKAAVEEWPDGPEKDKALADLAKMQEAAKEAARYVTVLRARTEQAEKDLAVAKTPAEAAEAIGRPILESLPPGQVSLWGGLVFSLVIAGWKAAEAAKNKQALGQTVAGVQNYLDGDAVDQIAEVSLKNELARTQDDKTKALIKKSIAKL